jgi:hypothetical protein
LCGRRAGEPYHDDRCGGREPSRCESHGVSQIF